MSEPVSKLLNAQSLTSGLEQKIQINQDHADIDVFIAGSGPIGATYAKLCVEAGLKVLMVEIGAADSFKATTTADGSHDAFVPGYHKKNEIEYQKDIDRFVHVIQGALSTVSVPVKNVHTDTLDPASWANKPGKPAVTNGKNPHQSPFDNLSAEAVTRGVGGMTTHWTCATPRFHPDLELPELVKGASENQKLWNELYFQAEKLIGTSEKEFDESIRHTLVLRTLQKAYGQENRIFKPLPLACHRLNNKEYVEWHATDRILEELYTNDKKRSLFKLLTNHRCTRLIIESKESSGDFKIGYVELKDLLKERTASLDELSYVKAKTFVIAAGAVGTPQILFNSGFNRKGEALIPNLGKYITEQPMAFCQVVLKEDLIDTIPDNPYKLDWWEKKVKEHQDRHPEDPLPIPFRDPEPQVTTPFSPAHPWHTQIHRDAFSYGAVAETIDTRLVVDFRFFGYVEPNEENRIVFETDVEDGYGMPQPTFHFNMSKSDKERNHRMMEDMCKVASQIGGYLPGSEPQFMAPGLALHLAGTVRAGLGPKTTVANTDCKVWNFSNLYVGGNGVIPTGFGANPTLTSLGYAIKSANAIIKSLK